MSASSERKRVRSTQARGGREGRELVGRTEEEAERDAGRVGEHDERGGEVAQAQREPRDRHAARRALNERRAHAAQRRPDRQAPDRFNASTLLVNSVQYIRHCPSWAQILQQLQYLDTLV